MKIESINLSQEVFDEMGIGLATLPLEKPLQMRNLGKCVVVAGKNGSGKTRLLTTITGVANKYLPSAEREQIKLQISHAATNIQAIKRKLAVTARSSLEIDPTIETQQSLEQELAVARNKSARLQKDLAIAEVLGISGPGMPKIVSFVPRSTELVDPGTINDFEAESRAVSFAQSLSSQGTDTGAPAHARKIMRAALAERGRINADPRTRTHQQAEKDLLNILDSLLGSEVQMVLGDDLNIRLEGFTEKYSTLLSQGQKVLFQLSCMLHAKDNSLHDCIIFLDEPENHLHPAVLNELVDRLQELLTDGQLWISTHSVPLIAHLSAQDPNCLWFADSGRFIPAGRSPEKVLDSLLGGPDGARRVNDLTLLPSRLASTVFLRQCLLEPGVIGYSQGDPQLEQIRQVMGRIRVTGQPLCVIDFGSGKGRLLDAIAQESDGASLESVVDYFAYEPHEPDADACQALSSMLYGTRESKRRAFSSLPEMAELHGSNFADVAIVCNVLHEVHPDDWMAEFGGNSALANLLKHDGYLLFVEDYALPIGERAHEFGFLLLDQAQLMELFCITPDDVEKKRFTRNDHPNARYQGRLIAHLVSTQCLARMTEQSRLRAIQSLQAQALDRLKDLLADDNAVRSRSDHGRESALVTQLVANSSLWLRENGVH
ncbi:AAA family ATPase [Ideonella margarita]|uniref:AAA family ATPase n=1 Tax=Ideonella margarita TaxID=2984191 RepID=A0ABU9C9P1_9BURK